MCHRAQQGFYFLSHSVQDLFLGFHFVSPQPCDHVSCAAAGLVSFTACRCGAGRSWCAFSATAEAFLPFHNWASEESVSLSNELHVYYKVFTSMYITKGKAFFYVLKAVNTLLAMCFALSFFTRKRRENWALFSTIGLGLRASEVLLYCWVNQFA